MSSVWLEWQLSQKNTYVAIRMAFDTQRLKVLGSEIIRQLILQFIGPQFTVGQTGYDGIYIARTSFPFFSTETLCALPISRFPDGLPEVPGLRVTRAISNTLTSIHRLCELQSGELARDAIGRLTIRLLERRICNSFEEQLALDCALTKSGANKRQREMRENVNLLSYKEKPSWANFLYWSNLDYAESIQQQCETKQPVPYEFILWKATVLFVFIQHIDLFGAGGFLKHTENLTVNGARFFRLFGSDSLYSMITNVSNGLVRATMFFIQSAQQKSWFIAPKFNANDKTPVIPLAPYSQDEWTGDYPNSCFEKAITAAAMLSDVCRHIAPIGMKIMLVDVSASKSITAKMKRHKPQQLVDE